MKVVNLCSISVKVTVENTTDANHEIEPVELATKGKQGSTQDIDLKDGFIYTVLGEALSQSPATVADIAPNAHVEFSLTRGVLKLRVKG